MNADSPTWRPSRRLLLGTVSAAAAITALPATRADAKPSLARGKPAAEYAAKIRRQAVGSDPSIVWRQFGPGMSGYSEQVWCHPTEANVVFTTPDLLNAYRSADRGGSWQTMKDSDGTGVEVTRLNGMAFALSKPDIGYAVNRQGLWATTNAGRSWQARPEWVTIVDGDIYATTEPPGPAASVFGGTLSGVAVDPTDHRTIYVGSGDFFNEKLNPHTAANPHGVLPSSDIYWRTNTGKVWKSTDAGASWRLINAGIDPRAEIGPIHVDRRDPRIIYLATSYGFYRSEDGGTSWTASNSGLDTGIIRDLTMHHDAGTRQSTLYAVDQVVWEPDGAGSISSRGGVFRSTDGGRTWTNISAGLRLNLAALPRMNVASTIRTIYFRALSKWFGITAAQATATYGLMPTDALQMYDRIAVDPTDVDKLYVVGNAQHGMSFKPGDVWSSDDGGQTWYVAARHGTGWGLDAAYWSARGTPTNVNMTLGHNAAGVSTMPYNQYGFCALAVGPDGDAYIWHYQQILRSTDRGATWVNVDESPSGAAGPGDSGWWTSRGDANPPGRGVIVDPSDGSAYLLVGENGLWRTDPAAFGTVAPSSPPRAQLLRWPGNETASTLPTAAPRSLSTLAIHPTNRDVLYVMADRQDFAGQLRKSTDRGRTWAAISQPLAVKAQAVSRTLIFDSGDTDRMYFCAPNQPLNMQAKTETGIVRGVYTSADGGVTWHVANSGLPQISTGESGSSVYTLAAHPLKAGSLFAAVLADGTTPGGLYRSDDTGGTWTQVATPAGVDQVNHVHIHPRGSGVRIYISTGRADGPVHGGGLWRSDDEGVTWTLVLDWPHVFQVRTHPDDPNKLLAILNPSAALGNINPGIYLSVDLGGHWTKINSGLGEPDRVYDATFDPTRPHVIWCSPWGAAGYVATY